MDRHWCCSIGLGYYFLIVQYVERIPAFVALKLLCMHCKKMSGIRVDSLHLLDLKIALNITGT
jgi:hypothetical protein